ncbi:DUF563 domain-containing protein [Acetobacter sp. DsW_063]|uniref:glycosyltransferase family 61 protein n=1 Tax=Acetobacter sp. DsW_063 TaxID=1514894 RepID=UPI000A3CA5F4|nr:glycosyltransferase 61 family protein [Acetobacter sp. DsW_063]OUJ15148.1 hypothetical protein HK28_09020 [Acetobacter sp. DsW_063]
MKFIDFSDGDEPLHPGASGFQKLRPAERVAGPYKIWELSDDRGWRYEYHWKRPYETLNPIGLYEVEDVIVTRPGGVILNRFVCYNNATGRDNQSSIPPHDDYINSSNKNKIIIEEPVIIADGVAFDVWGHWIVDYLPRFGVVRDTYLADFFNLKILLPAYTPAWITEFLLISCGVAEENILKYTPDSDVVLCKRAILPSYCYTEEFAFHSYVKDFYRSFALTPPPSGKLEKILVSRSNQSGSNRLFPNRDAFENIARERGYQIVRPEELSIPEQIDVFSRSSVVIGEHGSGMHSAVFCGKGTVVGCIGFWNAVQLHIGYLMEHRNVYLTKGCLWPTPERNEYVIDVMIEDLVSFFDKIDAMTADALSE